MIVRKNRVDAFEFYHDRPVPQGLTRRFPPLIPRPCTMPHSSPLPAVGGSPVPGSIVSSWIEFGEF